MYLVCNAHAVSADGLVVVGFDEVAPDDWEAFRWENGVMTGLGGLPGGGLDSRAYAVSADGSVVVGNATGPETGEAFIWDQYHGMRNLQDLLENDYGLDLTGWTLTSAEGISDNGLTITGYGINPFGNTEAWIAVTPAPSAVLLGSIGLSFTGWLLHRRKML